MRLEDSRMKIPASRKKQGEWEQRIRRIQHTSIGDKERLNLEHNDCGQENDPESNHDESVDN